MSEDKKYDSDDCYINWSARLTKDPDVFPSTKKDKDGNPLPPLVRITFVSESRQEKSKPLWIEARVRDFDAWAAAYLKKGDTLGVEGKPYQEEHPAGSGKLYHKLDRTALHMNIDLRKALKERGFVAGAKTAGKPAAKAAGRKQPAREVQDVDFGDEGEE